MTCNSYYLGDTFTSIAERLETLNADLDADRITLEEFEEETASLREEIPARSEWLGRCVFHCLEEIARDEEESLNFETSDLVYRQITPEALDGYLSDCGCRGFTLLADSANLAEYMVELQRLGWKAENCYRFGVFQGVCFESDGD